jgi:regulator of RNase E activity RraA
LAIAVFARGSTPASGSAVKLSAAPGTVSCGGVAINDGDIVVGDDDGLIAAGAARIEAALAAAREIERAEQRVLERLRAGRGLDTLTNYHEHVRRLEQREPTQLTFLP